jgi:WD40 repeat protein
MSRLRLVLPHKAPVTHSAFSPDGKTVLTSSFGTTARLWDAVSGKPIWQRSGQLACHRQNAHPDPVLTERAGRDWFPHMDAMHVVHQDGDRFMFLRRCDVASLQSEPDLPVYCFLLHEWCFPRTDHTNKQCG